MRRIRLLTRDGTKLNTRSDAATSVLHLSESLKRLVRSKLALQRFVGAISAYAIGVHFLNRHAIEQFVEFTHCSSIHCPLALILGTLRTWFDAAMGATASDSGRGSNEQ